LVNSWLRDAVKEALVGNATDEEVLRRFVEKTKNAIVTKTTAASLHDDMAYIDKNGRRYFTADAVYERVRQFDHNFKHRDLARHLKMLGCVFDPAYVADNRPLEVWSEQAPPPRGTATTGATPGGTDAEVAP
jgi:hypothetical protein